MNHSTIVWRCGGSLTEDVEAHCLEICWFNEEYVMAHWSNM